MTKKEQLLAIRAEFPEDFQMNELPERMAWLHEIVRGRHLPEGEEALMVAGERTSFIAQAHGR